ncbi:hypothetical protein JOD45_000936 [Scopulibacillus daqui]|uniref:Uncharacterized protein n=1 Tax=Scopulibacillus daqui TaxID=1469162 RepID=A0ABS2PXE4_9BACL|nr:hypothetical protein [Scopulibacillus daqui]MBM7644729.1 hypothetical protein [Scopulibacillus daqui]
MDILSLIKSNYYFQYAEWSRDHKQIIETDLGKRKVYFWNDVNTLRWHINWRHRLNCDAFYVDRMLVTKSGQLFIPFEDGGFLTCHDVLEKRAELEGNERCWGQFIGAMLNRSLVPEARCLSLLKDKLNRTLDTFEYMNAMEPQMNAGEFQAIKHCIPKVWERIEIMKSLVRETKPAYIPLTTELLPLEKGRWLSGKLFWEIRQAAPILGYRSFCDFFNHWLAMTNQNSLISLIETVDEVSPLNRHANQLLAAFYYPDEWLRMFDAIRYQRQEIQVLYRQFANEWEMTSRTTAVFYQFLKEQGYVL